MFLSMCTHYKCGYTIITFHQLQQMSLVWQTTCPVGDNVHSLVTYMYVYMDDRCIQAL